MERAKWVVLRTTSSSRAEVSKQLVKLSGWQANHDNWQQGRFRRVKIHSDSEQKTVLTITTSFMGLIGLARVNIQLTDEESSNGCTIQAEVTFSKGILAVIVFYVIFLTAIIVSEYNIIFKLILSGLIFWIAYWTFLGIYRDREKLLEELERIQNTGEDMTSPV